MAKSVENFKKERETLNKIVLKRDNLNIKRLYGLDTAVYRDGALDAKTKELMGLTASLVLRCDDCITHHVIRAAEAGTSAEEFDEVLAVSMVVGGSIIIPHVRRAARLWQEITEESE